MTLKNKLHFKIKKNKMVILNCIIITVLLKYFDQIDTALVSTKGDYKILD